MGDLPEPDGGSSPSTSSFSSNPNPTTIGPGRWLRAEKATQKIIRKVQPTLVSDQRRREVIDYVQRLFRNYLSCEVFPYGSVPLITYLPDGDIDLTAFGGASAEDTLANGMVSILEGEDQSRAADFVVKDIQLIRAEVKLVKCIVQNIVVDISFNQIGGLCTLCFLEQVDCLIGKEHLFKRSIILIKAWCYYESRILGAHHGLISTYALETLVLYIFHLFHLTLNGPLQVLYKFLDYFSKFDWENYCVSLSGPIRLSSLPDLVAEIPDNGGSDLLLSSEFLRYCTDMFSVPSRGTDSNSRTFQPKHLNIVDPLKENNNLGRSVSKGNFYRIRSAFTYGARKLGRILLQPEDEITDGISKYFFNTLDRHGNRQRPDVQVAHPVYAHGGYNPELSICETNSCAVDRVNLDSNSDSSGSSHDVIASGLEINCNSKNEAEEGTVGVLLSKLSVGGEHHETGNALDCRFIGDARDLATYRVESLTMPIDLPAGSVNKVSPAGTLYHAPHFDVSNSAFSSGEKTYENSDLTPLTKFPKDDHTGALCDSNGSINRFGLDENQTVGNGDVVLGRVKDEHLNLKVVSDSENLCHDSWDQTSRIPDVSSPLSDLSGDYENQLKCLQLGRWHYEYSSNVQVLPRHPGPPSVFQGKNSRDALHYSSQFKQNGFSHRMGNGVIPNPAFYAVSPVIIPAMAYGLEDMPKPRGTGTYFPILKRLPQGHRPSAVKGRSHAHASLRSPRNAVRNSMFTETNSADQTSAELSHESVSGDQSGTNLGPSNVNHSFTSQEKGHPSSNGLVLQPDGGFEFGSVENVPAEMNQLDRGRHWQHRGLSSPENASPVSPTRASRMLKPVATRDQDRVSVESAYRLKDEDDFPPLSF